MKHILKILAITSTIVIGSCSIHSYKNKTTRLQDTLLIDSDGNKYSVKKMADNKLWMTVNLKLSIPDSYCYGNADQNCERYGRLYTWKSAQKGCAMLGEGWRLPSENAWQKLTAAYGFPGDSTDFRKIAYNALLDDAVVNFNALLGGGRDPDGNYKRVDAHGFYWTATETDSSHAWFYNFGKGSRSLYRQNEGEKAMAISVRCIKEE
jgi:uncharacterized protein (TIGR02145 family)